MADEGQSGSTGTEGATGEGGGGKPAAVQQGAAQGRNEGAAKADGGAGFPADTPLTEMTAEQQASYWKHQARKHETAVKARSDYDELKSQASQYQALLRTTQTDQERAVADARTQAAQEATAAARSKYGAMAVDAQITFATAGRLSDDQRSALLEGLDRSRFLTDNGDVNTEAIGKFVDRMAPAKPVDMGQGRRGATSPVLDMNALIRQQAGRS